MDDFDKLKEVWYKYRETQKWWCGYTDWLMESLFNESDKYNEQAKNNSSGN